MSSRNKLIIILLFILISQIVFADLSISLKRTNPGIAQIKPAEMIFDIVNTNIDNKIEGFILCRSPDDIRITSTLGLGSGSGAQYISPKFEINKAPSQKAAYFSIESDYEGDYSINCYFKYIPFKEINGRKVFIKMNLQETDIVTDSDYREIRLDKNVPFVKAEDYINAYCPKGKTDCKSFEVLIDKENFTSNNLYLYLTLLLLLIIIVMLLTIYKKKNSF